MLDVELDSIVEQEKKYDAICSCYQKSMREPCTSFDFDMNLLQIYKKL